MPLRNEWACCNLKNQDLLKCQSTPSAKQWNTPPVIRPQDHIHLPCWHQAFWVVPFALEPLTDCLNFGFISAANFLCDLYKVTSPLSLILLVAKKKWVWSGPKMTNRVTSKLTPKSYESKSESLCWISFWSHWQHGGRVWMLAIDVRALCDYMRLAIHSQRVFRVSPSSNEVLLE